MDELRQGVELKSITGPNEGLCIVVGNGRHQCRRITVSMQNGQMASVPWARCEQNNGEIRMVNLAQMEDVVLMDHGETQ